MKTTVTTFIVLYTALLLPTGCAETGEKTKKEITLTLGAYTVPKDVYQKEIIPSFKKYWREKTGQDISFEESYEASGAQARAIVAGFEADVAALSLERDVEALKQAGLITRDWKKDGPGGMVTRSLVVIAYRPGNPKNIQGWDDLKRGDVDVLYPSPKTSGGAMWDINAIYGAGLKLSEVKTGSRDKTYAFAMLKAIQRRVRVMDKSGRMSVTTFENGIGDALLTYENEALLRHRQGKQFPFVIPAETILIENPVAVVDKNADKHGNREVAEEFVRFLFTQTAQRAFAEYGFRSVDNGVAQEFEERYPVPKHLFTVAYLGGWEAINSEMFGRNGIWPQIMEELARAQ